MPVALAASNARNSFEDRAGFSGHARFNFLQDLRSEPLVEKTQNLMMSLNGRDGQGQSSHPPTYRLRAVRPRLTTAFPPAADAEQRPAQTAKHQAGRVRGRLHAAAPARAGWGEGGGGGGVGVVGGPPVGALVTEMLAIKVCCGVPEAARFSEGVDTV